MSQPQGEWKLVTRNGRVLQQMDYVVLVDGRPVKLRAEIEIGALLIKMGRAAAKNASGVTRDLGGLVVVRRLPR